MTHDNAKFHVIRPAISVPIAARTACYLAVNTTTSLFLFEQVVTTFLPSDKGALGKAAQVFFQLVKTTALPFPLGNVICVASIKAHDHGPPIRT